MNSFATAWSIRRLRRFGRRRLLNGNDLIALGYTPGPQFREILSAVEDAQLEGSLHSKEEALSFVLSEFPLRSGG